MEEVTPVWGRRWGREGGRGGATEYGRDVRERSGSKDGRRQKDKRNE